MNAEILNYEKIVELTKSELRSKFDNTPSDFEAIQIIEDARYFGFEELSEQMIKDLSTSQDNMSELFIRDLIRRHEEKEGKANNES